MTDRAKLLAQLQRQLEEKRRELPPIDAAMRRRAQLAADHMRQRIEEAQAVPPSRRPLDEETRTRLVELMRHLLRRGG